MYSQRLTGTLRSANRLRPGFCQFLPVDQGSKRASAPNGVALHAAWVGGGFEHGALRGRLAGATGEATFRPSVADPQAVAPLG